MGRFGQFLGIKIFGAVLAMGRFGIVPEFAVQVTGHLSESAPYINPLTYLLTAMLPMFPSLCSSLLFDLFAPGA